MELGVMWCRNGDGTATNNLAQNSQWLLKQRWNIVAGHFLLRHFVG